MSQTIVDNFFQAAPQSCPLCDCGETLSYHEDERRDYRQCARCQLVFVIKGDHISRIEERAHYDLHTNSPHEKGYRQFLNRLAAPLNQRLLAHSRGLDFGCGPGPTLSVMLEEWGHTVALYDSHYAADKSVLQRTYDFITATEVVEHLAQPGFELQRLWDLIAPSGWLAVMTKLVIDQERFSHWHYRRDPTHISFFSRYTWNFIAQQWSSAVTYIGSDVILIQKPAILKGVGHKLAKTTVTT